MADPAIADARDPLSLSFKVALNSAHDAVIRRDHLLDSLDLLTSAWAEEVQARPVEQRRNRTAPRLKEHPMSKHNRNRQVKHFKTCSYQVTGAIRSDA